MTVSAFDLKQVRLLDGPFKENMQRDQTYLLQLDVDRLLHNFRVNAGLPSTAEPYGGWESPELEVRGHFVGHYLSACAMLFASTDDARFKARVDALVEGLASVQQALPSQGNHPGYLSAFPETFFDTAEARNPVWAPYYTLHKIYAGLIDAFQCAGSALALDVLNKLADWQLWRVRRLTQEQMQITLLNEPGGMNETLANLYAITGKPEHLELAQAFNHDLIFNPLARGDDQLDRLHANTQIPKVVGAARQYELTGDTRLREIARFFWERVALHRSYTIGGNSDDELFFPVEMFREHLTSVSAETCNTYNMLKLTRHLFSWEPTAQTMDFYERGLFNHILGSQDPQTGMMIYFASLKPGHVKIYNTPEHSFWCCTGTGIENHAKYGDTIFSHDGDALYVNLFIASELRWDEKGLLLRQETRFPETDTTCLTLDLNRSRTLAFKIRYPAWATGIHISINGEDCPINAQPGTYIHLEQEWHSGDQIMVRLPMRLRLETLPHAPHHAAILYGPIVLAGQLGTENLPDLYLKDLYTRITPTNHWPTPPVPALIGSGQDILQRMIPVPGEPLTFRSRGLGYPDDVTLIPFYRLHHQRYTVYWEVRETEDA